MKFLNKPGVILLWETIKDRIAKAIKDNITDKLGKVGGIATLDENTKLTLSQLPDLKTINGESVVGKGDITIDLSLYRIVEALPEDNIEENKIYLVLSSKGEEGNVYSEWIYDGNKWEKIGDFRTTVDLEPYLKTADLDKETIKLGYVKFDNVLTAEKNGVISKEWYKKLYALFNSKITAITGGTFDTFDEGVRITTKYIPTGTEMTDGETSKTSNLRILNATPTTNGVMSARDKGRLDNMADNSTSDEAISIDELMDILE